MAPPPSVLISVKGLSHAYGARPLIENLTFGLNAGERTGLIGPNGAGKSTLLKLLAGTETPDAGEIVRRRGLRIGLLAQTSGLETAPPDLTVRDAASAALEGLGLEPYELAARVDLGLAEAGFPDPEAPLATLSGGRRRRLAILAETLREPDLLLLDEPTNHLDLDGVLWLEEILTGLRFSFLVVTHDRRFLESVTNRVIELDPRYAEGHFSSAGNYSDFLERREGHFAAQAQRTASLANTVRREIAWLRRGAKARSTKQQARIDRAGESIDELSDLERRAALGRAVEIDFSGGGRKSRHLVRFFAVEKGFEGRKLFGPLDLILGPGSKLGLLGKNGSGKSTLLKILSGTLAPDTGSVKRAEGLRVVLFDQHRERLDLSLTLRKALCPSGEHVRYQGRAIHVNRWADRFLFRKDQFETPLAELSGGERSRVLIAKLMLEPADLLLLDEPTNDLDIRSLEVLEESLQEFPGALVLVTHDRLLLDRVSRSLLALDGEGEAAFFADLGQWEARRGARAAAPSRSGAGTKPQSGLSRKESKELLKIESKIQTAETALEAARAALDDPEVAADAAALQERQAAVDEAEAKVAALYARWEELELKDDA